MSTHATFLTRQGLLTMRPRTVWGAYVFLSLLCAGMGMGVPFFNIMLGFPVGVYAAMRAIGRNSDGGAVLRRVFSIAAIAGGITLLAMAVLWSPSVSLLWQPGADYVEFGIPMILYDPRNSFIGWLALMIIVSPVLQFMAITTAAFCTLMRVER